MGVTVAVDRLRCLRRLARPVIAVGGMSLTAYVGHFVVQSALPGDERSWVRLLVLVVGPSCSPGPLKHLTNVGTKLAKHIR
ncbi:hypothetical protein ACQPW3_25415 [Actinosynnema sp. CA-248983]